MCDEVVDDCLAALKFVLDWFVTNEMIIKLFMGFYEDENILYFNKGSSDAVFNCNGIGILNMDLDNINPDEDDPYTIILIRILAWDIILEKLKEHKNELLEELIPVASDPNRWWN